MRAIRFPVNVLCFACLSCSLESFRWLILLNSCSHSLGLAVLLSQDTCHWLLPIFLSCTSFCIAKQRGIRREDTRQQRKLRREYTVNSGEIREWEWERFSFMTVMLLTFDCLTPSSSSRAFFLHEEHVHSCLRVWRCLSWLLLSSLILGWRRENMDTELFEKRIGQRSQSRTFFFLCCQDSRRREKGKKRRKIKPGSQEM